MLKELATTLQTLLAVDEMSLNVGDSLERRRLEVNVEDRIYIELAVRLALAALAFVIVVVIPAAVCAMGICQPVDVEADDVHWCNKCCAGAFCCVRQAKLPPMRVRARRAARVWRDRSDCIARIAGTTHSTRIIPNARP